MQKRGVLARIGVTLLNLLAPGLGLLRIGKWELAAAAFGMTLLLFLFFNFAPPVPFAFYAGTAVVGLATYPVSMAGTWTLSATIVAPRPWYARWYAVVGTMLIAFALFYVLGDEGRVRYRNFYTPAEGMAPNFPQGDRFVAYMRPSPEWKRGDVVLVRTERGDIYIKRLVGLPGDLIAVTNGVVHLNGRPIAKKLIATEQVKDVFGTVAAKRLEEQFPGESKPHQIYDMGPSMGDTFGPVRVRPGHYFLMGDNRDRSADSRFGPEVSGLDQIRAGDMLGRPLYHSWGSSQPIGTPIINKL